MLTYTQSHLETYFASSQEAVGFIAPTTLVVLYANTPFAESLEAMHMAFGSRPLSYWPALQTAMQQCRDSGHLVSCENPDWAVRWELLPATLVQADGRHEQAVQCKVLRLQQGSSPQQELSYKEMLDWAPHNMWACSPKGEMFWFNAVSNRYRFNQADVHDLSHLEYVHTIHPDDVQPLSAHYSTGMETGNIAPFRSRLRRHDGVYEWFEFNATPVRDAGGQIRYWTGASINVEHVVRTEAALRASLVQQEAQLQRLRLQLADAQNLAVNAQRMDLVTHLAGGVAHDLNNMLFVMRMHLANVHSHLSEPKLLEHVDATLLCIRKAARLSTQLSSFSGRLPQNAQALNPSAMLDEAQSLFQQAVGAEVSFSIHMAPQLPNVLADRAYLENALINLLINARDAGYSQGTVRLEVAPVEHEGAAFVRWSVHDRGCGMTPELQAKIFEPFFTTKAVGKGTGLGLAMVKNFVESSGGWLAVESTLGEGTSVHLHLPVTQQAVADAEATTLTLPPRQSSVMLVEDDDAVRQLVSKNLRDMGLSLVVSKNHDKSIMLLEAGAKPDLILADIRMPGKTTALDVIRYVEALPTPIPLIFMTGYSADITIKEGMLEGRYPVLFKPFSMEELVRAMHLVLPPDNESDAPPAAPVAAPA